MTGTKVDSILRSEMEELHQQGFIIYRSFRRPSWRFWLAWLLMTTIAWHVAIQINMTATQLLLFGLSTKAGPILPMWMITALAGALGGLAFGALQWLVLKAKVRRVGMWMLASAVAMALAWPVTGHNAMGADVFLFGVLFGISLGIFQYVVMAHWSRYSLWWIPLSSAAWITGITALSYNGIAELILHTGEHPLLGLAIFLIWFSMPGIIAGSVTGIALIWLFRHPVSHDC